MPKKKRQLSLRGGAGGGGGKVKRRRKGSGRSVGKTRYMLASLSSSRRPRRRARASHQRVKIKSKRKSLRRGRISQRKIGGRSLNSPAFSKPRRRRRRRRTTSRRPRSRKTYPTARRGAPRSILKRPGSESIKVDPPVPDMSTSSTSFSSSPESDSSYLPTRWENIVRSAPQQIQSF